MLRQGADPDGACNVAEQFGERDKPVKITISIGVAQYRDGDTELDLTERADRALYRAKDRGRNRIERENL